jgi:transcriptional regulator with XRE-family HTH domain
MLREEKELKRIGARLKKLRVRKGFKSYETFAVEHDMSRMQYWRIEQGKTNLTFRSLIAILNVHKITLEEFFSRKNEPDVIENEAEKPSPPQ